MKLATMFLIATLALTGGCRERSPSPDEPPAAPTVSATAPPKPDTSSLRAFFEATFRPDEPGIAVLVAKGGRTVFAEGYGVADLETKTPITPRTLFNLGSLSKTFVANAILILQERKKLSVDDRLSTYFSFAHPEIADKIQLRHLLTHTSGLPDLRRVRQEPDYYLTARDAENWQPITQADALDFEPGARFQYSNPTFNGLALIIEKVSGTPWQTFVRDEIFLPSGMSTSTITDGPHPESGVAHGYVRFANAWRESDYGEVPTFAAAGNGGVWSSVEELARYENALRAGTFLPPATVADARTAKTFDNWSSADPPKIGWSWFIREVDGLREVGHNGGQGGFLTAYFTIPDKDILVVFLMNGPGDFDGVNAELHRWLRSVNWLD